MKSGIGQTIFAIFSSSSKHWNVIAKSIHWVSNLKLFARCMHDVCVYLFLKRWNSCWNCIHFQANIIIRYLESICCVIIIFLHRSASAYRRMKSLFYCNWYRRNGSIKVWNQTIWAILFFWEIANVENKISLFMFLFSRAVCYTCQENHKGSKATTGACMQCNKSGCKQQFHVKFTQACGFLCEGAGNHLDNVKNCGYCQHHYSKLVSHFKYRICLYCLSCDKSLIIGFVFLYRIMVATSRQFLHTNQWIMC